VDEYLTEKEQIEAIRKWWRENGWYLIGGALVAAIGYYGNGQYQEYQEVQAAEASAIYADLRRAVDDDRPGIDELLDRLVSDYSSSPYTDQARLLVARENLVRNPDRATAELRLVMESSKDLGLAMVARLRLARVLAYQESFDAALAVIAVEAPGEFAAQLKVIEGDIHEARGSYDDARRAYTDALTMRGSAGVDRDLLQMKLGDLPLTSIGRSGTTDIADSPADGPSASDPGDPPGSIDANEVLQ
jgi:predicted negative regulator of RcsB-dependent stress response